MHPFFQVFPPSGDEYHVRRLDHGICFRYESLSVPVYAEDNSVVLYAEIKLREGLAGHFLNRPDFAHVKKRPRNLDEV